MHDDMLFTVRTQVYGLAANALSAEAVAGVFAAKGRPSDNPLIVHVSDMDMLLALYPGMWMQSAAATQHVSDKIS